MQIKEAGSSGDGSRGKKVTFPGTMGEASRDDRKAIAT